MMKLSWSVTELMTQLPLKPEGVNPDKVTFLLTCKPCLGINTETTPLPKLVTDSTSLDSTFGFLSVYLTGLVMVAVSVVTALVLLEVNEKVLRVIADMVLLPLSTLTSHSIVPVPETGILARTIYENVSAVVEVIV